MPTSKELIKELFTLVTREFQQAGWVRRKPTINVYSTDLSVDAYGWVGLNRAVLRGQGIVEINPVVGVGHHKIEKLFAELQGLKWQPYATAVITTNIGYLMPDRRYHAWFFSRGESTEQVAKDMVETIEEFGGQFLRANTDLTTLCETMRNSGLGMPHLLEYRIPIAYTLLARCREAEAFVESTLNNIGSRADMAAETYREFVIRLREYMSGDST